MAKGKAIGEFSFKFTSLINIPGPADLQREVPPVLTRTTSPSSTTLV